MVTAEPGATLSLVEAVDAALDVILRRFPDLAGDAAKAKRSSREDLKAKKASRIAAQAVETTLFKTIPAADQRKLARVIEAVESDSRDAVLPPVRVRPDQLRSLQAEADKSGRSLSELIRLRLFGEDR